MRIQHLRVARSAPAADGDVLTDLIAVGRSCGPLRTDRLALASTGLPYARRVQAGLAALALDLPPATFCLECTTSDRAATEAMLALRTGLVLAADGGWAAAALLGDGPAPARVVAPVVASVLAVQSALAEYPGLAFTPAGEGGLRDVAVPDYAELAYLELVQKAAAGLQADWLALNPPTPRLGQTAARALGFVGATCGPPGAAGPLVALHQALGQASPGQLILLVSYGAGSAADALLVQKEE